MARKIFLIVALSLLSWLSTFTGMLDLIVANRGGASGRDIAAIAVAVAVLQLMTLYILDALFSGRLRAWLKPLYVAGYVLLTLISVTFSFGFYWNLLEARHQSAAAAMDSATEAQRALEIGRSRLQQLEQTFLTLTALSRQKGEQEKARGGSCGGGVSGTGPLQLREADAQRLSYAAGLVSQRAQSVQADLASIDAEFAGLTSAAGGGSLSGVGARAPDWNSTIREFDRRLGVTVSRYNALRSDPQLLAVRDELVRRGEQTAFMGPDRSRFVCRDPQLASALQGAARAIGELPGVPVRRLTAMEGEQATYEAFRRLQTFVRALLSDGGSAVGSDEAGLMSRDFLPLGIAVFVDFCIFLIVMNRPWGMFHNLLGSVEDAGAGELDSFLRLFHRSFVDSYGIEPKTFDLVRPLQDAVFSHGGSYFAVAPLSFPDQRGASDRLQREARYVANVFVGLEGRKFVKLVPWSRRWTRLLTQKRIEVKLRAQGSPFACAGAFRLYRFAPQAWQGIVLRSVLSAKVRPDAGCRDVVEAEWIPEGAVSVSRALQCVKADEDVKNEGGVQIGLIPPRRNLLALPPCENEPGEALAEAGESVVNELTYDQSESQDVDYENGCDVGQNSAHWAGKPVRRRAT